MTDLSNLTRIVVESIKQTEEYIHYNELLEQIKKDENLYNRIMEMREKNLAIQQEESEDAMEALDALTNEYEDVINLELVSDYLNAEVAYCYLIRGFSKDVVEGLDFI